MAIFINKIHQIARILNDGGVIIFPTETLYGLGCDATNPKALKKIYKIKQREKDKPFPMLVKDFKMLFEYADFSDEQKDFMRKIKKPTSFILRSKNLPSFAVKNRTAAFRISDSLFMKKLFKVFDKPITATSVNVSGKKPLNDPRIYTKMFEKKSDLIDAVVFVGINKKKKGSQIIDLTVKPYKIIRR